MLSMLRNVVRKIPFDQNQTILFNTMNNATSLIDNKELDSLQATNTIDSGLRDDLEEGDFLDSSPIRFSDLANDPESDSVFTVEVNMTEGCNLTCSYCYQNCYHKFNSITKETIDQICQYIESVLSLGIKKRWSYSFLEENQQLRNPKFFT